MINVFTVINSLPSLIDGAIDREGVARPLAFFYPFWVLFSLYRMQLYVFVYSSLAILKRLTQ